MSFKKKILINWDYSRKDLLAPILKLVDEFDLIFIYFKTATEYVYDNKTIEIIHWSDFSSPYILLSAIKPDKVVFCDIESFHQLALNIACKNNGIKTYHLEHGLKDPDEISLAFDDYKKNMYEISSTKVPAISTFYFFLRAIKFINITNLYNLIKFVYYRRKYGIQVGLHKCQYELRNADYYINFTKQNSKRLFDRDGIREDQLILIGNPSYDEIFENNTNLNFSKENYFLLIDTPLADEPAINFSYEQVNSFYFKLNEFCINKQSKLYIKLHPKSYNSLKNGKFLSHPNIIYICQTADLTKITLEAKGFFGFFSSMLVPIIYLKKCILFEIGSQTIQKEWEKLGMVKNLDFFTFLSTDISFDDFEKNEGKVAEYVIKYLYKADSNSLQRLKEILFL